MISDSLHPGESFPLFIAAEWYKSSTANNANHITKGTELVPGEGYKTRVDDRFQYGQKNAAGENRFLILHDKGRKPYQVISSSRRVLFSEYFLICILAPLHRDHRPVRSRQARHFRCRYRLGLFRSPQGIRLYHHRYRQGLRWRLSPRLLVHSSVPRGWARC